jgi:hypothetical protein
LGERRFVAVVEFERSRFLIGGTPGSLVLLAPLQNSEGILGTEEPEENIACTTRPIMKVITAPGVQL